jgi:hypothetical protein
VTLDDSLSFFVRDALRLSHLSKPRHGSLRRTEKFFSFPLFSSDKRALTLKVLNSRSLCKLKRLHRKKRSLSSFTTRVHRSRLGSQSSATLYLLCAKLAHDLSATTKPRNTAFQRHFCLCLHKWKLQLDRRSNWYRSRSWRNASTPLERQWNLLTGGSLKYTFWETK